MTMLLSGSTNVVRYFMMRLVADGTAATGLTVTTFDLQYTRELTASATSDAGIVGTGGATTHVDNKVFELDSTNSPGLYMVCYEDAAFAAGVDQVTLALTYDATVFTEAQNIQLVAFDPFDAVRMGMTSLPNAAAEAAGGLIVSTLGTTDADDCLTATGFATPTNITAGTITTTTNLTNLPTIPANWLTAAGTAADFTTEIQTGLATPTNITAGTITTCTTNTDMVTEPPTAIQNADALLDRDMSTGTDSGSPTVRTARQALRFLRNKWAISGGTLTVNKEDDSTASWTATVTTDAAADPVTGNDPA